MEKDRRKIINTEKAFRYFSNRDHVNIPTAADMSKNS